MKQYTFMIERCQRIGRKLLYFDLTDTHIPTQVMVRLNFEKPIREGYLHKRKNMLYLTMELEESELDLYPCAAFHFEHRNVVDYTVYKVEIGTISLCGNAPKGVRTIRRQLENIVWRRLLAVCIYSWFCAMGLGFYDSQHKWYFLTLFSLSLIWLTTSVINYEKSKI